MAENNNDSIMDRLTKFIINTVGFFSLILVVISCEKAELTRSGFIEEFTRETEDTVTIDEKSGISFELESDSLTEEIEDIYFHAEEWEEESMDSDL